MRKVRRKIKIGNKNYDIWLGITKKALGKTLVFKLHYYAGNPDQGNMKPIAIKSGFKGEQQAIEFGIKFMTELYTNAIQRQATSS